MRCEKELVEDKREGKHEHSTIDSGPALRQGPRWTDDGRLSFPSAHSSYSGRLSVGRVLEGFEGTEVFLIKRVS